MLQEMGIVARAEPQNQRNMVYRSLHILPTTTQLNFLFLTSGPRSVHLTSGFLPVLFWTRGGFTKFIIINISWVRLQPTSHLGPFNSFMYSQFGIFAGQLYIW